MSGVLADSSIWIAHFRSPNRYLVDLLNRDMLLTHPMVIGEIACGTPPAPRSNTLDILRHLAIVQLASLGETLVFLERDSIYGKGCGLIDMVLLTSTLITPSAKLWTLDKPLAHLAQRYGVLY